MSNGVYGTRRGADLSADDIEIFYTYSKSRGDASSDIIKLNNPEDILVKKDNPNKIKSGVVNFESFPGLYELRLPSDKFSVKGIYTIIIRPLEIRTQITDVGVLSSTPDVRGLVFDLSKISTELQAKFSNNNLIGYRIEYLTTTGTDARIPNTFRIITSNNKCEPVNQNLTNTNQKAIRYRFNDNASLVFCTLTPSSSNSIQPNVIPFIGQPNQEIILTNTFFNPIMLEVEVVEIGIEELGHALLGNQSKNIENGTYTIFNNNNEIYKQFTLFEVLNSQGKPLYEVREEKNNIDFTDSFENITRL